MKRLLNGLLLPFVELTRAYMAVVIGAAAVCAATFGHDVSSVLLWTVFAGQASLAAAGFVANDVLDRRRDVLAPLKPLADGRISVHSAISLFFLLLVTSLSISFSIGGINFTLALSQVLMVLAYSNIKMRSGLAANLVTALLCASSFMYGAIPVGRLETVWLPSALCFALVFAREVVKDILDLPQDEAAGVPTLPNLYGTRWATVIVSLTILVAYIGCLYVAVIASDISKTNSFLCIIGAVLLSLSLLLMECPSLKRVQLFLHTSAISFPLVLLILCFK